MFSFFMGNMEIMIIHQPSVALSYMCQISIEVN